MSLIEKKLHRNTLKQFSDSDELIMPDEVIASWDKALYLKAEDLGNDIKGLRNPQLGGIYAALTHWTYSHSIATVVMPTGTGKTETMLSLLVHSKCSPLLVIVPTDPLREQISNKFIHLGLLKKPLEILNENALHPVVGILKKRFSSADEASEFMDKCNVVVATASILSKLSGDVLEVLVQKCAYVFIDEAHHAEAKTWFEIRDKFKGKRVLQFTATPYRNDGKKSESEIVYSYPLKKAQQEGYFKKIEFIPLYEYDPKKADKVIAEKAVEILRADRKTFPHILLARVETKKRADEVYEIYTKYTDLKVAKIYSGIPDKDNIKRAITNKEYQIVVCVDMLGEGFDLPELKIAAFHDVKKSLPTTVQFVGRFTRTKYDKELGSAKVIVNLAGLKIKDNELDEFYAQDTDWDEILPRVSELRTQREIDFQETVAGFKNIGDFVVSLRSLKPAMSTVIYKGNSGAWDPKKFEEGVKTKRSELIKSVINRDKNILAGIKAEKVPQKWTDNVDVFDLSWTLYLIHWDEDQDLLFIHSSDNESLHESLAQSIIGDEAEIIDGENKGQIFRSLDGVKRFKLQNVGLIQVLGKLLRFQMSVGTDIEPALSKAEINRAKKSHVFGVGYENGNPTTIGCSYKGRVWSNIRDDIDVFIKWCRNVGKKALDESIDPEQVLRGAIVPKSVPERPSVFPVCIDWSNEMYQATEDRYEFRIGDNGYYLYSSELVLIEPSVDGNIKFGLESNNVIVARFELQIFPVTAEYNDFRIVKTYPDEAVTVVYGRQEIAIEDFFYKSTPEIWFADGSVLEGSSLSELKEDIEPYQKSKITTWDWTGIDLSKESQDVNPKLTDSIQYRCIEILGRSDYDIIYDDDYSGEIADIIAIKKTDNKILVELYHLKYAKEGRVSTRIDNLYEVCGQVQKSIHWKFKQGKEFFEHMLRRKVKTLKGEQCPRLQRGTEQQLKDFMTLAKYKIPLEFKMYIVQPSISVDTVNQNQLTLLGVTENYLKEKAQVELVVIGSDK
jgi:superfamily II DNA or RNA helicase